MLDLSMALDADLGIDSIKRVEILSALQERLPEAPPVKPEELGALQTLGQIVAYLQAGMGEGAPAAAMTVALPVDGGGDSAEVAAVLLAVVADKTGYPQEMLELNMALDADLGIDSIKRVEILSALQERLPALPAVKPEELGVLQTLGQIVTHLSSGIHRATPAGSAPAATASAALERAAVATALLGVIADKTGYPQEMLELEMALDADLGIDSIKRVEILSALQERLPGAPPIKPEHLGTLQTVGQIVDFLASVSGAPSAPVTPVATGSTAEAPAAAIERQLLKVVPLPPRSDREPFQLPAGGTVWVSDDGGELAAALCAAFTARGLAATLVDPAAPPAAPASLAGLILLPPAAGSSDASLLAAFRLLQLAGPALRAAAASSTALCATVARLNGRFGLFPGDAPLDPLSGGLAGLSKTAGHEWPQVRCRALDLAGDFADAAAAATAIVEELLHDGPVEVGLAASASHTLKLSEQPLPERELTLPLGSGEVVVISGGARGVTAEAAVSLARSSRATLLLLGRSPAPEPEPAWLSGLKAEGEIKAALIAHAAAPLKPREVEERYRALLANREVSLNLQRIADAGGRPLYRSVDLRDTAAVAAVLAEARAQGPIRGLIHGAGVLADRLIADKTPEQFEQVYATKVAGLENLLAALTGDELGFIALFSSSTGRFGRTGQVDYAVANEVLNKRAQQLARLRPACRVVSLNWGPWDGGMVTPALKKLFASEGVEVIDLQAGADYLVRELSTPPGGPVELVILGSRAEAAAGDSAPQNVHLSKAFDLELSVAQFPFLASHVIDGKAVLPMAMIVEWLAHAAIHNHPGLRFHGFNDLRILKGVTLEADKTCQLQVLTGKAIKSDGSHIVPVELTGIDSQGRSFVHSRARIVLTATLPQPKGAAPPLELAAYSRPSEQIYQTDRLFHGPALHGISRVAGCANDGITALVKPAPAPQAWIEQPLRNSWLADPLALDSAFQMMILWSFERFNAANLPVFAGRYRQFRAAFPAGSEIRVRISKQSASKATAEIEFLDPTSGELVARLDDYECVIDASLNASFQRNTLPGAARG
jgi:acyl carrier protein/NAD(P)-dependent dehydrogenase (short-subunit alcohol dehydrogenase family)